MFGMMPPPWMMGKGDWGKGDWGKGGWNDFGFGKGGKGMKGGSGWVWTSNSESDRPEPEPHDNLYVKNLPPGIKEDEVIKTFSQAGEVVECRVLSWDGVSECAALVRMSNVEQATKAKELIHGKVHENCHQKLSVALQQKGGESVPDHVFVKGLHCTTTQDQLQKAFSVVGEVKWTKILPLPFAPNPTKLAECCGLVQFSKAEEAEAAIEKFNNEVCPDVGLTTIVRYAEVQSTEKPEQKPNSNLYVKGWPVGFPDFLLQSVFQQYGQVVRLRLLENPDPEQPTCAALVQMSREDEAAAALKALHGQTVSPQVPSMHVKHAGKDQSPSGNLYVTSLPRTITEEEIRETFKKFGEVKRLRLLNQEKSPELRALVELESTEIAAQAVRELDNTVPVFKGPVLYIQYASKSPAGRKGE
jgi:RNA recognition motif-containing protein